MRTLCFFFSLFITVGCFAQKQLEINDVSDVTQIYACEDRFEAKVIFYCDKSLNLEFESNYNDLISLKVDSIGSEKKYEMIFPTKAKGTSYDGRVLTVYAPSFDKVVYQNFNFPKGTVKEYKVIDHYSKAKNPYYKYVYAASDLFALGNYTEARSQYVLAKEFPEYEQYKDDVNSKIAVIDSIFKWRDLAEVLMKQTKYLDAHKYYMKIVQENPTDENIRKKMLLCLTSYDKDCGSYFAMAEDLYNNKERKKAKTYYQKVIDMDCPQKIEATNKLLMINNELESKTNKNTFFTYEYHSDVPIGFTIGSCKRKKVGGYFTIHANAGVFDLPKKEKDLETKAEANISFGFTRKIVAPVWIFFGPGYTGGGHYVVKEEDTAGKKEADSGTDDGQEDIKYKLKWYNSISPEIGLIVKIWHFNLKYTFQYRFALSDAEQDYLGKNRHYIGVGFAW